MAFSLGIGHGLNRMSVAGDFGNRMWSSYVQLNPGVYSDAIATEFKRRMKPDYVNSAGTGYYYNTFGPSGLNKTTADWIGIMVTSLSTAARTNTKTGAVMKWNMDGTIYTQNNLPAYAKGANAGIITFTSTDGFAGVTFFDCNTCNLTHLSGLYGTTNLATFYCYNNQLTSLTTYTWTNLANFQCNGNKLTSLTTYAWSNLNYFYCNGNQLTSLTNFGTNKISVDSELGNYYTTAMVNSRLAYYNAMFAATPPIKNLTLNLSGATMGIPTGGNSNVDLVGIMNKFGTAGFTATISIRTS